MERHRFDPFSFVLGVLVVALAAAGLLGPGSLASVDLRWAVPAVLVALGLALVATTVGRASADRAPVGTGDVPGAVPDTTAAGGDDRAEVPDAPDATGAR
jgi:hypothetical protein